MDEKGRMDMKERIEEVLPSVGTLMTSGNTRVLIKHITTLVSNLTVPREVYEQATDTIARRDSEVDRMSKEIRDLRERIEKLTEPIVVKPKPRNVCGRLGDDESWR